MVLRRLWRAVWLILLAWVAAGTAAAQAVVEYGSATSKVGAGANAAKAVKPAFVAPASGQQPGAVHLPARVGEAPEITNRRALEARAREDAGKLLLRSVPTGARVWIDSKYVGRTPLLLILAPGSHEVEMQGERMELGRGQVNLLPRESRQLVVPLVPRYPTQVRSR